MTEKQECPTCKLRKLQDDVKFYEKAIKAMIELEVFMDSDLIHRYQNKIRELNEQLHKMGR